jgi:serine/threonine protein kinase
MILAYLCNEAGLTHFGDSCAILLSNRTSKKDLLTELSFCTWQMTTAIAIEDVRREVKLLKSLSGHKYLIKYYDACEDANNVYIVMELCDGGELLDRILARGGKYPEDDAKAIVVQILTVVSFCHLQGVVHRDLKPEVCFYKENFPYLYLQ